MNEIKKCYVRLVYLAVLMSLMFSMKKLIQTRSLILAIGYLFWFRPLCRVLKFLHEVCAEFNLTKEASSRVKMKLNIHIRGGGERKKMSSHQKQTAWAFCQLACLWELVKSSVRSYFNTLTRCSEAAGGAAQRKLWETGFQKQKIFLLTDSITISHRLGLWHL